MPLSLIIIQPGQYTISDNGTPGDNTSVITRNGATVFTFIHPADALNVSVTASNVHFTVNFVDTLGAADFSLGALLNAAQSPNSITARNLVTTGTVTLASDTFIASHSDVGADIDAFSLLMSAGSGIGSAAQVLEVDTAILEARTTTGGITLKNFAPLQIGGTSATLTGLNVETSGNINVTAVGRIYLSDADGAASVLGGSTSGNVKLVAQGGTSDILATVDNDAVTAPRGNISLSAGRDIAFGTLGVNFDNDVRASGAVTINAGRDFLVDGFSDISSDDFGQGTGGNVVINAGRNIHLRNINGSDAGIAASGTSGADVVLTAGVSFFLDAPNPAAVSSSSGNVVVNADQMVISSGSGITASDGQVVLRPVTAGRPVIVGSASEAVLALTLSNAEIDRVFADSLTIGSYNAGSLVVISNILSPANTPDLTLQSGGDISLMGHVSVTGKLTLRAGDDVIFAPETFIGATSLDILADQVGNDGNDGATVNVSGIGGAFPISITGGVDADRFTGNAAANTLRGAGGNDILNGGGGSDTAVYSGAWKDYRVTFAGGVYTVKDLRSGSPEGTDTVTNVELFKFSNGTFTVGAALNNAPTSTAIPAKTATEDVAFSFNAAAHFSDADTPLGDKLTYSLSGAPAWLKVNAATGVVSGTPGFGDDMAGVTVTVRATDVHGAADTRPFTLNVIDVKDVITGTAGKNTLIGGGGVDEMLGLGGADKLFGKGGNDILDGGDGNDLLVGGIGADSLKGGKGKDTASYQQAGGKVVANLKNAATNQGEANGDTYGGIENLTGGNKGDVLTGNDGANVIKGLAGNDKLKGLKGADRLEGGVGKDVLTGGGGGDAFIFRSIKDSAKNKKLWDVITDFSRAQKDKIDLSGIDAKTGPKNQAFTFIGDDAFSNTKGELRYDKLAKKTFVYGDVNGDGNADFRIELAKAIDLVKADFVV